MEFPDSRILLFAKAPLPGRVKTRLIPRIGARQASDLHAELLWRTLGSAAGGLAPLQLWCTPDTLHPLFQEAARAAEVSLHSQVGNDLGERMAYATKTALAEAGSVLLIGADCPVLARSHLRQALDWLAAGRDAVLGPAEDGGYVLLGLRRHHPQLFEGMAWGTGAVLQETRQRLRQLGLTVSELETLWDLDRAEDLQRYRRQVAPLQALASGLPDSI
ncbi:MAG: TIGR04282 family arsenosugar biosynthesis glycosyltransferase [Sedimenticola sp.]|nr:TIGR04282 family arsenosugar biosynthesis glycosyltransferase [Sedimenticola sp.]